MGEGGIVDKVKGRVKEAAGALLDDEKMRREGRADQTAGKAKDKADEVIDKAKEKASELIGSDEKDESGKKESGKKAQKAG